LDSLARSGTWFNKAYTSAPACVPARTSLIQGRFPSATRVRSNHNIEDVVASTDMIEVVNSCGYRTALIGKNHSYLTKDRFDYWKLYGHLGMPNPATTEEKEFNDYLKTTNFYADFDPAPFPPELQHPYRIVTDAQNWISSLGMSERLFFLIMSFPEPHSPYQVSEPYFSMYPEEELPPVVASKEFREVKGRKYVLQAELLEKVKPGFEKSLSRVRSNYLGMVRLIDDQIKRFVEFLENNNLRDNTVLIFISDHGDFMGEYGLPLKGVGLSDYLTRIPMFWNGPGISENVHPHRAHVSIVDVFPTICDMLGIPLPDGVQGRSLWPMLTGQEYPEEEFASVLAQQGFGGLDYTSLEQFDPYEEGCIIRGSDKFDELNTWSQSGILRMLRKNDWKLVYDAQGRGQLFYLPDDPAEVKNLFGQRKYKEKQMEMLQEMLSWELRVQDPLPFPRKRYKYRRDPHNYWAPYRKEIT